MNESSLFAHLVARVGDAVTGWRRLRHGHASAPALGTAPAIPAPRPQSALLLE